MNDLPRHQRDLIGVVLLILAVVLALLALYSVAPYSLALWACGMAALYAAEKAFRFNGPATLIARHVARRCVIYRETTICSYCRAPDDGSGHYTGCPGPRAVSPEWSAMPPLPPERRIATMEECAYCHTLRRPCRCHRPKPKAVLADTSF